MRSMVVWILQANPEDPSKESRNCLLTERLADRLCSVFKEPAPSSGRGRILTVPPAAVKQKSHREKVFLFLEIGGLYWKDQSRLASGAGKIRQHAARVKGNLEVNAKKEKSTGALASGRFRV